MSDSLLCHQIISISMINRDIYGHFLLLYSSLSCPFFLICDLFNPEGSVNCEWSIKQWKDSIYLNVLTDPG